MTFMRCHTSRYLLVMGELRLPPEITNAALLRASPVA